MFLLPLELLSPLNIVIHQRLVVLFVAIVHLGQLAQVILLQLKIPNALRVIPSANSVL